MQQLPPDALDTMDTRVLLALVHVHERDGRATVTTVAEQAHLSRACVHTHLSFLKDAGLVTWVRNHSGTLRPIVAAREETDV